MTTIFQELDSAIEGLSRLCHVPSIGLTGHGLVVRAAIRSIATARANLPIEVCEAEAVPLEKLVDLQSHYDDKGECCDDTQH